MLTPMNKTWKGASTTAKVVPIPPMELARNRPAQVGQAVKSPTMAPEAAIQRPVRGEEALAKAKKLSIALKPTSTGMTRTKSRLRGTSWNATWVEGGR
jgi:hypothetical protein